MNIASFVTSKALHPPTRRFAKPLRALLAILILLALSGWYNGAKADTLSYFNFNSSTLAASGGRNQATSAITTNFSIFNFQPNGTTLNAQNGDPAGNALNLLGGSSNNGNYVQINTGGTAGFKKIQISLAGQRDATGFNNVMLQYSTNGGASFQSTGVTPAFYTPTTGSYGLQTFDLSSVTAVENNPNALFRLYFNGASDTNGTNAIDNVVVTGVTPEPETWAMMGLGLIALTIFQWRRKRAPQLSALPHGVAF